MDTMKRLFCNLCIMVITLNVLNASPKLYLYLLPFENINDDYQEVEGKGLVDAKLQGPLNEKEKTSMMAVLSVKTASFFDISGARSSYYIF